MCIQILARRPGNSATYSIHLVPYSIRTDLGAGRFLPVPSKFRLDIGNKLYNKEIRRDFRLCL